MPNLPISGLPDSILPLDGTELFPLEQSGVTDKISADDLGSNPLFNAIEFQSVPIDQSPFNLQGYVYVSSEGKYESKYLTFRQGEDVSPKGVNSVGIFENFQQFTLPAGLLTGPSTIIYEIQGQYSNSCTLQFLFNGNLIDWIPSNPFITFAAPTNVTNPNQAYEATLTITRINSTQANVFLKVTGGFGDDQFTGKYYAEISLIDWTAPITVGAQGRCEVAVLTVNSLQATCVIK